VPFEKKNIVEVLKHVVPEEMLDVNKRLAKGRRLSGTVNGFIWMDRRKSSSSQTTNQILYWLVGMKDISTLNPLFKQTTYKFRKC